MIETELQQLEIKVEQIPNTPMYRIRANGRMIGHVGSRDGANINLFNVQDDRTREHILEHVKHQLTNRISRVVVAPVISEDARNPNRALDDIDDFDA